VTKRNAASWRVERKRLSREMAECGREEVLCRAHELIDRGVARFVAYELVLYHAPTRDTLRPSDVMRLSRGVKSWGDIDAKRTLMICRALISDPHDLVQKAVSWALRELSKRDPDSVRRFLARHRNRLPARVRREVTNKLTTGRKRWSA